MVVAPRRGWEGEAVYLLCSSSPSLDDPKHALGRDVGDIPYPHLAGECLCGPALKHAAVEAVDTTEVSESLLCPFH